jgi:hypothetical protein
MELGSKVKLNRVYNMFGLNFGAVRIDRIDFVLFGFSNVELILPLELILFEARKHSF